MMPGMRPLQSLALLAALSVVAAACGGSVASDGDGTGGGAGAGGSTAAGAGGSTAAGASGSAPVAGWAACSMPGDCWLAAKGCCAPCEGFTLENVDSVHKQKLDEHFKDVCPTQSPQGCPGCFPATNPNLVPVCALGPGACTVIDVANSVFSECSTPSDCVMRFPQCCECGAPGDPVALAKSMVSAYLSTVCSPTQACAECAPAYPSFLQPTCDAGHCKLVAVDAEP